MAGGDNRCWRRSAARPATQTSQLFLDTSIGHRGSTIDALIRPRANQREFRK